MAEIVWKIDVNSSQQKNLPQTVQEAIQLFEAGNRDFVNLFDQTGEPASQVINIAPADLGLFSKEGGAPAHEPIAGILSCSDARIPLGLIFGRPANDLFVTRVAGNVPGGECIGSLDYAINNLKSVRLLVVLGHTDCGAVSAAVRAILDPSSYLGIVANLPLRAIVDSIVPAVNNAAKNLEKEYGPSVRARPGYQPALIELTVILNTALTASVLIQYFQNRLSERLGVAFGVYNLANRTVGLPDDNAVDRQWQPGLLDVPLKPDDLLAFSQRMAQSKYIRRLLRNGSL